jgi:hypothetical protein
LSAYTLTADIVANDTVASKAAIPIGRSRALLDLVDMLISFQNLLAVAKRARHFEHLQENERERPRAL